jgi:hypothetical protein
MAPGASYQHDFVTAYCERQRGEGVMAIANRLREEEAMDARLAVKAMQTGKDPSFYLTEAGRFRATRYEYQATGDILRDLNAARLIELRRRTGRAA